MTVAGHLSTFGQRGTAHHVYIAATMDAAVWGAELARGRRGLHSKARRTTKAVRQQARPLANAPPHAAEGLA